MVFESLTLFEVHLDGAQFGPETIGVRERDEDEPAATDESVEIEAEPDESGGRGVGRVLALIGAGLLVSVAVMVARRRFGSDGGDDGGIGIDADVAVETTPE